MQIKVVRPDVDINAFFGRLMVILTAGRDSAATVAAIEALTTVTAPAPINLQGATLVDADDLDDDDEPPSHLC